MNNQPEAKQVGAASVVHIFIDGRKYEFTSASMSGAALKAAAGARPTDGLYHKVAGKLVEVANDEILELKNGEHFNIVPDGTVS